MRSTQQILLDSYTSAYFDETTLSPAQRTWMEIINVARHAPSPHNVQPWFTVVERNGFARLYIKGDRTFPFTDSTGSFVVSSMNMFLACLSMAAQNRGYTLTAELETPAELDLRQPLCLFALLNLEYTNCAPGRFSDRALMARKTSRKPNLKQEIPLVHQQRLVEVAESHGYRFEITDDQELIDEVLGGDISALFYDINDPEYFGELRPMLDLGAPGECTEGLHYSVMNMARWKFAALKHMPWSVQIPLLRQVIAQLYRKELGYCAHMGFLCGDFWELDDAVNAGTALIELWLTMSQLGIVLHPFGNLVTNRPARAKLEKRVGIEKLFFVCRLGYTDEPLKSGRLPLLDVAQFE